MNERKELIEHGVPAPQLMVSDRAQLVLPCHVLFDKYEEERLGNSSFGSTQCGIAPFYSDKYLKVGIQVADMYEPDYLRARLGNLLTIKNALLKSLYGKPLLSLDEMMGSLLNDAEQLRPYVADTSAFLLDRMDSGQRILLEGQLGALRDPDHGIYPFSTSSSPLAGFASVGAGIPPHAIRKITAVAKAYSTCVGAGPFVSEIQDSFQADELRQRGGDAGEYGATTGRPRRMGWFDALATRYGCRLQGATEIALSVLDVLGYLEVIPVCVAYEINGQTTRDFPTTQRLYRAKPVYENMPGWKCDIRGARAFDELPLEARNYVAMIEQQIGIPIRWISVGPHRDAILRRG